MRTWIRSGLVLALFLIFVGHAAGWLRWGLLAQLEFFAYDVQVRADARGNAVDRRVVVLDIDEPSLAREGQWPWPRARLAEIVERLYRDYGVFTIGFDIVFAEPGRGRFSWYGRDFFVDSLWWLTFLKPLLFAALFSASNCSFRPSSSAILIAASAESMRTSPTGSERE